MVQVRVGEGILEGEEFPNEYGGNTYYSFKGIPYAEPPVGPLRFKAPQPPKPWEGVRSAKECGSQCIQYDIFFKSGVLGSENCLYLNVYSPQVNPSKPLPVMVWIHGGAFLTGSGNDDVYAPHFLVKHDVVLVTINYRLEVLGFLCLDTEDVPGNAGMKDQVQALKWVKKNISNFGGDPNNITIFGESAGAASVSYLLLSPMTKGLFKRAIAQSGAATCDWSQSYKPLERAFALGRKLGLYTDDVKELYEFLKAQPVESLINAQVPILLSEKESVDVGIFFSIVDEKQFGNQDRFFYGNVLDNIISGIHDGVDVMTGYTTEEGIINIGAPDQLEKKIETIKNYLQYFVPKPLALSLPTEQQLEIGRKIKNYYFKDQNITVEHWKSLVDFYSMSMFIYGTIQWVKLWTRKRKSDLYFYKFSCKSERNVMTHLLEIQNIIGNTLVTAHADDFMYLFNTKRLPNKVDPNSDTFKLVDRVTKLWTNFAKYGNPTPDDALGVRWQPYKVDKEDYLDIGNTLEAKTRPDAEEIQFWEDIYRQYAPQLIR